jgi:hypothetical protein
LPISFQEIYIKKGGIFMEKFTLYVGLNDKDTKQQKISTLEAYKITNNVICKYAEGGTIYEAQGIYKHDDGTIVFEKTLRIELLFVDKKTVEKIANILKAALNQESIAVQYESVESELI